MAAGGSAGLGNQLAKVIVRKCNQPMAAYLADIVAAISGNKSQ